LKSNKKEDYLTKPESSIDNIWPVILVIILKTWVKSQVEKSWATTNELQNKRIRIERNKIRTFIEWLIEWNILPMWNSLWFFFEFKKTPALHKSHALHEPLALH